MFAVGGDSPDSKRFAFYGIDDYAAGETAGSLVGQWAADGGILVRRAAVLTGDAGDQGSFDLMRGFVAGLSEIHSGVEWVNGPADVDSFGFDPFAVHDATEAWVLDNIDADIVFHTDEGLEALARVMADQLLYGDMYAVGFHMSEPVTNYIRERVVVTAMVQGLAEQARRAGAACGDFLLGRHPRHRPRGDRAGGGDPRQHRRDRLDPPGEPVEHRLRTRGSGRWKPPAGVGARCR